MKVFVAFIFDKRGEKRRGEQACSRDKQRRLFVLESGLRRMSATTTHGQDDGTHLALVVVHLHTLGSSALAHHSAAGDVPRDSAALGRHAHPPGSVHGRNHAARGIGNRLGADDAER
jgi:hypothetical protein